MPELSELPRLTLGQALSQASQQGLDRFEAQVLLLHVLQRHTTETQRHSPGLPSPSPVQERGRAWLLAHDQDALPWAVAREFQALVKRRLLGEPVAYLTGERGFFGLSLQIDARVLDPRPDTETLVEWALELLKKRTAPPEVLDLGTGSGAIALAIQHHGPQGIQVSAVDASPEALAVAQANEQRLRGQGMKPIVFYWGSWLAPVAGQRFDLIVSNPPYIAEGDAHLGALCHEPRKALVSGPEGLDDLRHLIAHAPKHLQPGAWLLLEHGWDQAPAVRQMLTQAGFEQVKSRKDLAGIERCSGGHWPDSR